jgi:hypothetical protein
MAGQGTELYGLQDRETFLLTGGEGELYDLIANLYDDLNHGEPSPHPPERREKFAEKQKNRDRHIGKTKGSPGREAAFLFVQL